MRISLFHVPGMRYAIVDTHCPPSHRLGRNHCAPAGIFPERHYTLLHRLINFISLNKICVYFKISCVNSELLNSEQRTANARFANNLAWKERTLFLVSRTEFCVTAVCFGDFTARSSVARLLCAVSDVCVAGFWGRRYVYHRFNF